MKKFNLQELAELMRDIAYSDNLKHGIDWRLAVVHPCTNDGDVGYSGGLWNRNCKVSVSFSFSESRGIHDFKMWLDRSEIRYDFGEKPSYEQLKEICIKHFGIEQLYRSRKE